MKLRGGSHGTYQLWLIGEATVFAGVIVRRKIVIRRGRLVGTAPLSVPVPPLSVPLNLVIFIAVVLVLAVVLVAGFVVPVVRALFVGAFLFAPRSGVGPPGPPPLSSLREKESSS